MAAGGRALSPIMVGRDAELAQLRLLLSVVEDGPPTPPIVVVEGEAGVGKTRLLGEVAAAAREQGFQVLAGYAAEGPLPRPFGLFRDAVREVVEGWPQVPDALVEREHPLRHVLFPVLTDHGPGRDHEHTNEELVQAAIELVRWLTVGPTLLVFEDLHWADPESLTVLYQLGGIAQLPLMLIGSMRPEEPQGRGPLIQTLTDLERRRTVIRVRLARLGRGSLAAMLEAVFSRAVPAATALALHERTQGNPFFVEELVAGASLDDPAALAAAALPWNATEAVRRRLDDLPDAPRSVLHVGAVLGLRFPFELLRAVTDMDERTLTDALRLLIDRGFVDEVDRDLFGFRHALTREAVATQLLGRERQRIHAQALVASEEQGSADMAGLVAHAAGAGDDAKLVRYAVQGAAEALREGSVAQALGLADAGLAATSATADDELALRAIAARAAFHCEVPTAAQYLERWQLLAAKRSQPLQEAEALRLQAVLCWFAGDREGYWARVRAAHEAAERLGDSVELAWCRAFLSQAHALDGDPVEAYAWAERAAELAERVHAGGALAYALVTMGTVAGEDPHRVEEALRLLREAQQGALSRHDVFTARRAIHNALEVLLDAGHADRMDGLIADAEAVQERYGRNVWDTELAGLRARRAVRAGDLAAAEGELRAAGADPASVTGIEQGALLAFLLAEREEVGEAGALIDQVLARADATDDWGQQGLALGVAVAVDARSGSQVPTDRDTQLLAYVRSNAARRACQRHLPGAMAIAALTAARSGVPLRELNALVEGFVDSGVTPPALSAAFRAVLADRQGALDDAADAYREALAAEWPWEPWQRADLSCGLARCLSAAGDRVTATGHVEEALSLLDQWRGWRREKAEALHGKVTAARGVGPGLTARELEVLRLVADGRSNRDIAAALFIAPKTAAIHVSNILAKTGTASRTEAATWAVRAGLLDEQPDPRRG